MANPTPLLVAVLLTCSLCASITYYSCPASYFFDVQHCETCLPNCICSAKDTCSSCIAGYTPYNGNCIQCPQSSGIYGTCSSCCSKTTGTILSCTDCTPVPYAYTFLYSGRCIVTPGCFEIDASGFCTECFPGFYEQNNLCNTCDVSCGTCTDATNCLTCARGYYWGVANGGLCVGCPSGCASCDVTGSCYSCLASYYLFQSHCLNCPALCSSCTDGSTCTGCSSGILVSNLCITCQDTTYGGSAGCTSCIASNNFILCTLCQDMYYLDVNGVCQSCAAAITGAVRCRDANTPTQCQNDYSATLTLRYYLVGITCIANSKNCRKIADINANCSSCYAGYTLTLGTCALCPFTGCVAANASVVGNTCTCTACLGGYYLTAPTCTACSALHCTTCPANACTVCAQGYHLSGAACVANALTNCLVSASSAACTTCADGYYKGSNNLCFSCQANCQKCTARFVCTVCAGNYFLHSSGSCVQMPSNCLGLAVNQTCSLCGYGYYLYQGYCLACKVELGTLNKCEGLCPIDYYIQSLVIATSHAPLLLLALPLLALLL